jgi:prolipoprotein diacylglyceryltransferase
LDFPVYVLGVHPHRVFDALSLLVGAQLFWWQLRRHPDARLGKDEKLALAAGCIVGAALGAKLIVLLEDPAATLAYWDVPAFWLTGKSIVGALLGGLVGVEIGKKAAGVAGSTGDHFVVPLCVGLAVGRVGCFLSGLTDDAYGVPTTLPWGVDFGDGPRHPTQLYEIGFALAFLACVPWLRRRAREPGEVFAAFMVSYFAFRFAEEVIRVAPRPYLGLTVYQLACAAGIAYYASRRSASPAGELLGRENPADAHREEQQERQRTERGAEGPADPE